MGQFKESFKELGEVKANSKKTIIYEGIGELSKIRRITTSCECAKPMQIGNNIKVVFKAGVFPRHLVGRNSYETMKQFVVYYVDGTKEVLSFKAKITKK